MNGIENGICVRTAYASEAIARTKLGQIRRGRERQARFPSCKVKLSTREYEVSKCEKCGLWHVSSRNGKG